MSKLRKSARAQDCLVRLVGVCNGDKETTVLCHFRMSGASGMGLKPADWLAAFACSSCHAVIDANKDAAIQLDFAHGVFRTIAKQIEAGLIRI